MNTPLTTRETEKLLARISYAAVSLGLAAASFVLVLCFLLIRLLAFFSGDHRADILCRPMLLPVLAAGIVFLLPCFLFSARIRKDCQSPLEVLPQAEEYYRFSTKPRSTRLLLPSILLTAGFLGCLAAPYPFGSYYLNRTLSIELFLTAAGAYLFAARLQKRLAYRRIVLIRTEASDGKERYNRRAERRFAVLRWVLYWTVVLAVYVAASIAYGNFFMYAPLPVLAAANCAVRLFFNRPFRRFASLRSRRLTVRLFNLCSLLLIAYLYLLSLEQGARFNEAYIASLDYGVFRHHSSFTYDPETGVYTVSGEREEFRILQLTDIHLCASATTVFSDRKALNACYALILETQPDLILVTGDVVFPIPLQSFTQNNLKPIYQFCTFMNKIGIPWAMVYGNHETEALASYNARQLSGIYRYFKDQPDCPMLYADVQPEIYGRYNQYLRIENPDGTLNHLVFLIDSNDYVRGTYITSEYDSVHSDQIAWYAATIDGVSEQEGRLVPSFVFMHIPFKAFAEAQEALKRGSPDAVYLFGENKEAVSYPEKDYGFFDQILKNGSTEAVFAGHDHVNNLGVKYKGVDLVYSKSIDYIAYPGISKMTDQRGGTLITLSQDGSYTIEQVDYRK